MAVTIRSLTEDPLIRTHLVAGGAGLNKPVTWAHTCEVADPWNWLGHGELLMTDGYSFPADPDGQCDFLTQLHHAGLAGVALAEGLVAPPLTEAAITVADQLGFPVLITARNVPFVTVARAVADGQHTTGTSRASRVLRLYDILRRTHNEAQDDRLLALLGHELKAVLHVVELDRCREVMPAERPLPDELRAAIRARADAQGGRLAAFNRLDDEGSTALLVPVGAQESAALLVGPTGEDPPEILLAQHAAMIAELEVAQRAARNARIRARGTDLLRQMLTAGIDPDAAAKQMRSHRLGAGPWRVTAWEPHDDGVTGGRLSDALTWAPWPYLHARSDELHVIVVEDAQFDRGLDLDDIPAVVGVSQPLSATSRVADAFREAKWALDSAKTSGVRVAVYDSHSSFFRPKTLAEGETAVRSLLGPLLDYDDEHEAQLVRSLWVYFEANKSWLAGSRRLGIHKQTLMYRIRKVQDLTGLDLQDFGTQAELYLALRTWRLIEEHRADSPAP